MGKIYIVMFRSEIFVGLYYTDESEVSKKVEQYNKTTKSDDYWYRALNEVVK